MKRVNQTENSREPTAAYSVINDGTRWNINAINPEVPLDLNLQLKSPDGTVYACNFLMDVKNLKTLTLKASRVSDGESRELTVNIPTEFDGRLNLTSNFYAGKKEKIRSLQKRKIDESSKTEESKQIESSTGTYTREQLEPYFNSFHAIPYVPKLESLVGEDGIIKTSDIDKFPEDKTRFKLTLRALSIKESRPVEITEGGYKINDRGVFQKIIAAAELKKKGTRTETSNVERATSEDDTRFYTNFVRSVPYISQIQELVGTDGVIKMSDINRRFTETKEKIRIKQILTHLTKVETQPVTKTDVGYMVKDRGVFDKISKAANLKKK